MCFLGDGVGVGLQIHSSELGRNWGWCGISSLSFYKSVFVSVRLGGGLSFIVKETQFSDHEDWKPCESLAGLILARKDAEFVVRNTEGKRVSTPFLGWYNEERLVDDVLEVGGRASNSDATFSLWSGKHFLVSIEA